MFQINNTLPGGRVIHGPYILVAHECTLTDAIRVAIKDNSGCNALFIHSEPKLGLWTVAEGLGVATLLKDKTLRLVWIRSTFET